KAGIFDTNGASIASAARPYTTHFPRPGWAEQDPAECWSALVGAVQDCVKSAPINGDEIVGLSADATTCTLIPLDAKGQVLRKSLLWMDVRATEQAARIFETDNEWLRYSLAGVSAEWMPAKMLWLKKHEPETYQQTRYLLEYTDWIAYCLTGR